MLTDYNLAENVWRVLEKHLLLSLMYRIILLIIVMCLSTSVSAQRRLVVCDVETSTPISSVSVRSSAGVEVTDSLGYFSVPDSCKSLLFSHLNYESRMINLNEVRDTVFLVSKYLGMNEVVVFGRGKDDGLAENMNKMLVLNKTDAQLLAIDPANGGNLFGLVAKVIGKLFSPKNSKAKRKEKAREILKNY